jgi:hypothetical protein
VYVYCSLQLKLLSFLILQNGKVFVDEGDKNVGKQVKNDDE